MAGKATDPGVWCRAFLLVTLVLAGAACGDDSGGDGDDGPAAGSNGGTPCQSGTSYSCVGTNLCSGHQRCQTNGFLEPCRCDAAPADASGMAEDGAAPGSDSGSDSGQEDASTTDAQPGQDAEPPSEEDCNNDVDDDEDGDADCADDDCSERTCVEEAPSGWSGPVLIYEGGSTPPACGGGFPDEAARGGTALNADAADCSTCTCTPEDPGCATFVNFETSTDSACNAASPCSNSINGSCVELASACFAPATTTGYVETLLPGAQPNCTASMQDPTLPDPEWDEQTIACAPDHELTRAGCDSGQVCAPEPPFDGAFCIIDDGDVPCPSGPYDNRRVYFTSIADTRDCSACSCGHDCSYTWRVFAATDTTCATPLLTLTQANQCASVSPTAGAIRVGVTIAGTGECAPSGGAATGSAQAEDPITACCLD